MFRLDGKTAVVTGSASGIGLSIAQVFARQGAAVKMLDLNEDQGLAEANKLRSAGLNAEFFRSDVSSQQDVLSVFRAAAGDGPLDIVINNAGISHIGTVATTSEADMDRVFNVNVKGVYNGLKAAVEIMESQKSGVILNLASVASTQGLPERFAYSMSKGAVLTMTLSVACDFVKKNIRCNCICPARVHTPFVDDYLARTYPGLEQEMFEKLSQSSPIGRMAKPEEIAAFALYLCSDEAGFATGGVYYLDGGMTTLHC